jgi:RimJ/RimL family protein N-acetyltransferase
LPSAASTGEASRVLAIRELTAHDLAHIATWAYDGPWSVYDSDGQLDPALGYWAVVDAEDGRLQGFACLGADARVPGLAGAAGVLDVGVGMRPDLVGQGRGADFVGAVVALAEARGARRLRAVVQDWNERSLQVFTGLGFARTGSHPVGPVTYVVLERPVRPG